MWIAERRSSVFVLAIMLLAGCTREEARPPSVLLVVLDTVGAQALGAYGNPRPLSPQFDAVAAAGALFTDVTAPASWTWPSHAALFTGEPPWVNGAHAAWAGEGMSLAKGWLRVTPMREDLPTLAGRLSEAGYATSAVVANRLLASELGITRGFGEVAVLPSDAEVTERALTALRADEPRPRLLFVNLMGAHSPFHVNGASWSRPHAATLADPPDWARPYVIEPPGISFFTNPEGTPNGVELFARGELPIPGEGRAMLRDLHEGEVLGVDMQLNALISAWIQRYPAGVVIVTADHGELLGEHDFIGHGSLLYSRLTRVPLAIVAPGKVPAGSRSDLAVGLQDIYGTVLALAGVEDAAWTLLDALAGRARPEPVLAAEWPQERLAERVGGRLAEAWRLIRDGQTAVLSGSAGSLEMYDLAVDPWMTQDLAAERPAAAAALAAEAARLAPIQLGGDGIQLSEEQAEALRAMGYIDP